MNHTTNLDKQKNIDPCKIFVVYWIILIVWQNMFQTETRGGLDAIIKVLLLGFLIVSFLQRRIFLHKNNLSILAIFAITQIITLMLYDIRYQTISIVVSYLYPIIYIFLVYCIGNDFTVTKKQVDKMNNWILAVLTVSVLYTVLFDPGQYTTAINAEDSGYGNELKSFFTSMFEYAMYLFYGITVCANRITEKKKNYWLYYLLFFVFFANMVFTFSRTALVGCLVYLFVYAFLNLKSNFSKAFLVMAGVVVIVLVTQPRLWSYVYEVVWKSGHSSSREELFVLSENRFSSGTLLNKIFGYGITNSRNYYENVVGYGSVHNGYLQVLSYYGLAGVAFLVIYLVVQVCKISRFFRYDKNIALSSLGMLLFCILTMIPTTLVIFSSSIDCFFLTSMMIIIPKYQRNAVLKRVYYEK